MDATDSLAQAIETAQNGDVRAARALLKQIVRTEPENEMAWAWLGEVAFDVDERIDALKNVVRINPLNSQAQSSLHYLRKQHENIAQRQRDHRERLVERARQWFKQAKKAHQQGQHKQALDLLVRYVEVDDSNEIAWLMLSELVPSLEDKIVALENVLSLNPKHKEAQKRSKALRNAPTDPLARGMVYENLNDLNSAISLYIEASMQAKTSAEKMQARRRLELAQIRQNTPHYRSLHPSLTIIRLTAGPILLYFCLFLLQSGFNLLTASPLLCLANISVLLGSLLLVLTSATPVVHIWYSLWQRFGDENEELARSSLLFLAGLLILMPFIFLFITSFIRS